MTSTTNDTTRTANDPTSSVKGVIEQAVARWSADLVELSHSLHREPELGCAEYKSRDKLVGLLERAGFTVESPVGGLDTAFTAVTGSGDLTIGLCAEYDALPEIGHACGHNVNGAASLGAALALAAVADELGLRVKVIGTPAEETIGGKAYLLEAGVFDDVAAAMMVHASGEDVIRGATRALSMWEVEYTGTPAHAASAPWRGVNALDAVSIAYHSVGLLRQQLRPDVILSFVVLEGGQAANVIPSRSRAVVELRTASTEELHELQARVRNCLEAGALATGASLTITPQGRDFEPLHHDEFMTTAYAHAMAGLGRAPVDRSDRPGGSTDMGNVSAVIPSIHPSIGYDVEGAAHHTREFAAHGATPSADRAVLDGALGMALVGAALAQSPEQRQRLHQPLARPDS
ncbi:M20 family metallopeptidase [Streptomyces sp. NPDC057681]|uniref:M20 family metallopeptidase n=1 Tax=Streptomyces sp. NPDC057681 TaxID=3346209 RepID=UPI003676F4E1